MVNFKWTLASIALFMGALGPNVHAQDCSNLATSNDGVTVSIDLTGAAAGSPALFAIGQTAGSTVLDFGMLGSLTLGLTQPFSLIGLGSTDGNGDLSMSFPAPVDVIGLNVLMQGMTLEIAPVFPPLPGSLPFTIDFCTSNVSTLSI